MEPTEKLFSALLALIGGGMLWALGWLVKNSTWQGGVDSRQRGLQKQVDEAKEATDKLEGEFRQCKDNSNERETKLAGAVAEFTSELRHMRRDMDKLMQANGFHRGPGNNWGRGQPGSEEEGGE